MKGAVNKSVHLNRGDQFRMLDMNKLSINFDACFVPDIYSCDYLKQQVQNKKLKVVSSWLKL